MRGAFAVSLLLVLGLSRVAGAQSAPGAASAAPPKTGGPAPLPGSPTPEPDHPAPVQAAPPYQSGGPARLPETSAPAPAPTPAPAPADDSGYRPTPPAQSAATHPQPGEYRVWRLVDPTEADWHAPDPNRPRGWFRVDVDPTGASGYVGGSYRLADGLAFAPFAHVGGTVVQPNLAVTWQLGGLWLMPALGTSIDLFETRARSLDPQLFAALDAKLIYLEAWAQYFIGTVYHAGTLNVFEARLMLLVSICSSLGVGVEYDPSVATNSGSASAWLSSIIGGRTNVRIGDHDTIGLFLGYQGVAQARGSVEGISGRFEFVHQW